MSATPNMPIQSEPKDWTARESGPRRSIYGNFAARGGDLPVAEGGDQMVPAAGSATADIALARAFLYRHLAKAFEYPSDISWLELTDAMQLYSLDAAVTALANPQLALAAASVREQLETTHSENHHDCYVATFGHAARGPVPMNEIEFGELRADALFQPHRLADLAAFYRAHGLEIGDDAGERHDHLSVELEFLSVLAAKEAYAMRAGDLPVPESGPTKEAATSASQLPPAGALAACRESHRDFLREHLGRWAPAFARVLIAHTGPCLLAAYASLLRVFIESECARCAVPAGNADLVVRQVDEEAESVCDSCGLKQTAPGAIAEG